MSDDNVSVAYGESAGDTATLLLAAAEELELDPSVVSVDTTGTSPRFSAPAEVAKKAGLDPVEEETQDVPDRLEGPTPDFFAGVKGEEAQAQAEAQTQAEVEADKAPTKKTAAKKATAKKTAASK